MKYEKLHISPENIIREKQVLVDIVKCINQRKSWYFDAGAGAGKTYALIQTLKLILSQYGIVLKNNNQKILCITYTNVAAEEVKTRLGETTLVDVSTIHDSIWAIISSHQKALVNIHERKVSNEIHKLREKLNTERWSESYAKLSAGEKSSLQTMIISNKDTYYKHKQDRSDDFKKANNNILEVFPTLFKNVANYKKIVDTILRLYKYENVLAKIKEKASGFTKVTYDARFNEDKLEKMRISHDTLLEYAEIIIRENDILKQMICDQYVFVIVDEYQDTSPLIVRTLNSIDEYAKKIGHPFQVGYYGDVKQNIYEEGVGINLCCLHTQLVRVEKVFNRRCSPEVIGIANKIRNDGLIQESIYEDFPKGEIVFYNNQKSRAEYISHYIKKWNISESNKLHCLELTNELVAEESGFSQIYSFYKNSAWYKRGMNFKLLRDHILGGDEKKLGVVQRLIFSILNLKYKISQDSTMIVDILKEQNLKNINIITLRNVINKIQNISGETLKAYIINMYNLYGNGDTIYDSCIEYIIAENIASYTGFNQFILNTLYLFNENEELSDKKIEDSQKEVDEFFNIEMSVFEKWYEYITDTSKGSTVYHTYHSTKGREFDNVIIFMNSKFGRKDDFFKNLLKVLPDNSELEERGTDIEKARNLLYVAVTRATKNLCIVYFDDMGDEKKSVQEVFGTIKENL